MFPKQIFCKVHAPTHCKPVHLKLSLFLKGEVESFLLMNRIVSVCGQADLVGALELTAPFAQIQATSFWK